MTLNEFLEQRDILIKERDQTWQKFISIEKDYLKIKQEYEIICDKIYQLETQTLTNE